MATNRGVVSYLAGKAAGYLGGIELQMSLTGRGLAARGWDVSFVVADEGQEAVIESDGVRLIKSIEHASARRPWTLWRRRGRLASALRAAEAETCILQGVSWQASVIARHCATTGGRFIFWVASDTDPMCMVPGRTRARWWERGAARWGIRQADAVVAQTLHQADLVREHLNRESVVIRNIWPYPVAARTLPEEPTVLWVANVRPVKRPEMLLEIARRLPETRFVMVGGAVAKSEEYYREIRRQAEEIPNLECTGFLPFAEADALFAEATVLLNTSAVEGFPNTYLQAWARGAPVVASFDPDEVICRRDLGVHFETVDEAVSALGRLCGEASAELAGLGERTTAYVRENHTSEVVLEQLEELLKGLSAAT